jgi:hypothetical protein
MEIYLNSILNTNENVVGEIYIIKNYINNMVYVGKTLSHRKNKKKYRPFGYIGRFKEHISEALCNTKKNQCNYLNNAIRKYSENTFVVELIIRCAVNELDNFEKLYISKFNSIFPNGYNLTEGGITIIKIKYNITEETRPYEIKKKTDKKSEETKNKISNSLKQVLSTDKMKDIYSETAKQQHLKNKIELFKDIDIDRSNLEKYLYFVNGKNGPWYKVKIAGKVVTFSSKFETKEQIKNRAITFLKNL